MKTIYLSILFCSSLLPQTPSAPSKGGVGKEPPRGPGPGVSLMNPASLHARAPEVYKALFSTTKGDFTIEVHRDWAPIGADRFYNLVKYGFFDNVAFFRVVPNFMVQFGISGNPKIEAAWAHANIRDEPLKQGNTRGRISFAAGGPNTRTTQVFINFKDNSGSLDSYKPPFASFGEVTEGMDVVDKLYGGYGDMQEQGGHGPSSGKLESEGTPYLDKYFPQIDKIKTAKIVP